MESPVLVLENHLNELFPLGEQSVVDPLIIRDQIEHLEAQMFKLPQIEIKTTHHFAKGMYAREIFIPKGSLVTGKIHKHEHLNIVSQGDITVLTENGVKRIKAPFTMLSFPGTKRVGFAHEDTIWTTIHATEERDLEKLESELICKKHEDAIGAKEIEQLKEAVCHGSQQE